MTVCAGSSNLALGPTKPTFGMLASLLLLLTVWRFTSLNLGNLGCSEQDRLQAAEFKLIGFFFDPANQHLKSFLAEASFEAVNFDAAMTSPGINCSLSPGQP